MTALRRAAVLAAGLFIGTACATVKPPSVRVSGIHLDGISLTGARVDVGLQIRNVNPENLQIERFDYEIKVNGKVLGRGFQSEPLMLQGFKEDKVVSRVDVNFLRIPGAVKEALDHDKVDAEVKGTFYVREGSGLKKIGFGSRAKVDLNKGVSRNE